jgi:hypothetical protein
MDLVEDGKGQMGQRREAERMSKAHDAANTGSRCKAFAPLHTPNPPTHAHRQGQGEALQVSSAPPITSRIRPDLDNLRGFVRIVEEGSSGHSCQCVF